MLSAKRDREIAMELDRLCVECNVDPKVDGFELCSACYDKRTHAPSRHHCCICNNPSGEDDICLSCSDRAPPRDATYEQLIAWSQFRDRAFKSEDIGHQGVCNNVLQKFTFSMGSGQQTCSICLDTIDSQQEMTTLPCFDMFHKECILSWLKQKLVCPLHTNDLLS